MAFEKVEYPTSNAPIGVSDYVKQNQLLATIPHGLMNVSLTGGGYFWDSVPAKITAGSVVEVLGQVYRVTAYESFTELSSGQHTSAWQWLGLMSDSGVISAKLIDPVVHGTPYWDNSLQGWYFMLGSQSPYIRCIGYAKIVAGVWTDKIIIPNNHYSVYNTIPLADDPDPAYRVLSAYNPGSSRALAAWYSPITAKGWEMSGKLNPGYTDLYFQSAVDYQSRGVGKVRVRYRYTGASGENVESSVFINRNLAYSESSVISDASFSKLVTQDVNVVPGDVIRIGVNTVSGTSTGGTNLLYSYISAHNWECKPMIVASIFEA